MRILMMMSDGVHALIFVQQFSSVVRLDFGNRLGQSDLKLNKIIEYIH